MCVFGIFRCVFASIQVDTYRFPMNVDLNFQTDIMAMWFVVDMYRYILICIGRYMPIFYSELNTDVPMHSNSVHQCIKGGGSLQLYYHDCLGTASQVTPQGRHRQGSNWRPSVSNSMSLPTWTFHMVCKITASLQFDFQSTGWSKGKTRTQVLMYCTIQNRFLANFAPRDVGYFRGT